VFHGKRVFFVRNAIFGSDVGEVVDGLRQGVRDFSGRRFAEDGADDETGVLNISGRWNGMLCLEVVGGCEETRIAGGVEVMDARAQEDRSARHKRGRRVQVSGEVGLDVGGASRVVVRASGPVAVVGLGLGEDAGLGSDQRVLQQIRRVAAARLRFLVAVLDESLEGLVLVGEVIQVDAGPVGVGAERGPRVVVDPVVMVSAVQTGAVITVRVLRQATRIPRPRASSVGLGTPGYRTRRCRWVEVG